jgi:hypothetical protein
MKVESDIDATRAAQLVNDLRGVSRRAERALEADELRTLNQVANFLESAACIETGERIMESPATGTTYRVTRWIDAGGGQVVALAKEEIDGCEASSTGGQEDV